MPNDNKDYIGLVIYQTTKVENAEKLYYKVYNDVISDDDIPKGKACNGIGIYFFIMEVQFSKLLLPQSYCFIFKILGNKHTNVAQKKI